MAVKWLTHPMKPANLIFFYHDQPDVVGHVYGPNSSYYDQELKKVVIYYLLPASLNVFTTWLVVCIFSSLTLSALL